MGSRVSGATVASPAASARNPRTPVAVSVARCRAHCSTGKDCRERWFNKLEPALKSAEAQRAAAEASAALGPLPPGWVEAWSQEHNCMFYTNASTGQSTWERPSA